MVVSSTGNAKQIAIEELPVQARTGKGLSIYKTGELAGAAMVNDEDTLLLVGKTSICVSATEVPQQSRTASGSPMIKDGQVRGVVKL